MKVYIYSGWNWCKEHPYIWVALSLYQLLWGFFVYRIVNGIVMPILHCYPNPAPTRLNNQLFWIEFQLHLMKKNGYIPYLWILISFIIIHMLLTPLIQGGLFRLMSEPRQQRSAFFQGIKVTWKPLFLLYIIETLLCIAPLYWFVPFITHSILSATSIVSLLATVAPFTMSWFICGWLLHQLFLFLKFGAAARITFIRSIIAGFLRILPFLGLSLLFIGATLTIGVFFTTAAMVFTGLTALIIQQALPVIFTILKLWGFASRYAAWREAEQLMK